MASTITAEARRLGAERGHASATWAEIDELNAAAILEDGEPEEWAMARPGPLSGEWAGDPTPTSLAHELGESAVRMSEREPERYADVMTAYEHAWEDAYAAELARRAAYYADGAE